MEMLKLKWYKLVIIVSILVNMFLILIILIDDFVLYFKENNIF